MNIYDNYKLDKIILATGNFTEFGGSIMSNEVIDSMREASKAFVDIRQLQDRAGEIISKITKAESGIVTSGAAAGLVIATAACITRKNVSAIKRIPDTKNLKNEVIVQRGHSNNYDRMIKITGANIKYVENSNDINLSHLESLITNKTAAIEFVIAQFLTEKNVLKLEEVVSISKKYKIPLNIDAANELPPISNLQKFIIAGADMVIFSGGKDIRGPQSTGFICGKKELIESCLMNSSPNHSIGRSMKVGKEEIIGFLTALQRYVKEDHNSRINKWEKQIYYFVEKLRNFDGMDVVRVFPDYTGRPVPRAFIKCTKKKIGLNHKELQERLKTGSPKILVMEDYYKKGILIDPSTLFENQIEIIANKIESLIVKQKK